MPEEKKTFRVPRGGRVEVGIAGDPEETRRPEVARAEDPKGAPFSEDEDEPYLRRLRPGPLAFFDLGTRLRSVDPLTTNFEDFGRARAAEAKPEPNDAGGFFNEYLEAEVDGEAAGLQALARGGVPPTVSDPYSLGAQHVQAEISDALQHSFDAALLGKLREGSADAVSPLDTFKANASGRKLPACAPFPFVRTVDDAADYHESDGPTEAFDFELHNEEGTLTFPNTTVRERVEDLRAANDDGPPSPSSDVDTSAVFAAMVKLTDPRWKEREVKDSELVERWNHHNVEQGEAQNGAEHLQKEQPGRYDFRVRSRLIFESFDTADKVNFKVTRGPRFEADEADFLFSGSGPARVFLRPSLLAFGRSERWTAIRSVSFETYKFQDGDGHPAYAHNRGVNAHTTPSGIPGLDFDLSLQNVYDAAAAPQSLTVTMTVTSPGVALLSTGDEVHDAGSFPLVPGLRVNAIVSNSVPVGSVYTLDVEPAWQVKFFFAFTRAEVVRGMHVGRWPMMPRAGRAGWDSMLTFGGAADFSFTDTDTGTLVSYSAAEAAAKTGRAFFHDAPASRLAQSYDRHAARDRSRLVFRVQQMNASALGLLGVGVTEAEGRAMRGSVTAGGVLAAAGAQAALSASADADAAQLAASVGGLGAHVRNVHSHFVSDEMLDRGRAIVVPPVTVPAGILCAIIKQGSTFYVWRKTPDNRGGYDFDRNQGSFRLS